MENNNNSSDNRVKFWQGTQSQYDILVIKGLIDKNTIYFVSSK